MKKNVIVLIALLSIGIASYAQQVESLGSVPAWVKEKTTPEEYQVWKFLSEYYQIDYSGLKSRDFQGQRKVKSCGGICFRRYEMYGKEIHILFKYGRI